MPGDGRSVNNMPTFPVRGDKRREYFNTVDNAHQVDANAPIPIGQRGAAGGATTRNTGVIN